MNNSLIHGKEQEHLGRMKTLRRERGQGRALEAFQSPDFQLGDFVPQETFGLHSLERDASGI